MSLVRRYHSIFPTACMILLFFPHNSLSLVEASHKFTHVVDGVYLCVCFLPIDGHYSHRSKLSINHDSWEFICNLGFEYGLLRGRRQWRWTAAVSTPTHHTTIANKPTHSSRQLYIACRVCTIFHVTGNLAGMSSANQSICKACFHVCFTSCGLCSPPFHSFG